VPLAVFLPAVSDIRSYPPVPTGHHLPFSHSLFPAAKLWSPLSLEALGAVTVPDPFGGIVQRRAPPPPTYNTFGVNVGLKMYGPVRQIAVSSVLRSFVDARFSRSPRVLSFNSPNEVPPRENKVFCCTRESYEYVVVVGRLSPSFSGP